MVGNASANPPNYSAGGNMPQSLTQYGGTRVQPMSGGSDVGPSNPLPVTASGGSGSASIATAQVSVAATSTSIAAARTGRVAITITQLGTTDVYVGVTGVTTATGSLLAGTRGTSMTIPTAAAVFGIAATGTDSVSVLESF